MKRRTGSYVFAWFQAVCAVIWFGAFMCCLWQHLYALTAQNMLSVIIFCVCSFYWFERANRRQS